MSATGGPDAKPLGSPESNEGQLPAIDETRPNVVETTESPGDGAEEGVVRCPGSEASAGRRTGVKGKLRGLKDKYVSCLQALDGAGDLRACADGPALAPAPAAQPSEHTSSSVAR